MLPGQISDSTRQAAADRATLSSLLRMSGARNAPPPPARRPVGVATATATATAMAAPLAVATPRPRAVSATEGEGTAAGARAAMGEWVNEMRGRGNARAPTEEEIATLTSMFPNLSREVVVNALQRK